MRWRRATRAEWSLLAVIGAMAAVMTAVVPIMYDDRGYRRMAQELGVVGMLVESYETWNGRVVWLLFEGVLLPMPDAVVRRVPGATFLLAWTGLACLIGVIARRCSTVAALSRVGALNAAGGVLLLGSALALRRIEVVIWVTGTLTYLLPVGLLCHGLALLLDERRPRRGWSAAQSAGGLVLIAAGAGCSESTTVSFIALLGAAFVLARSVRRTMVIAAIPSLVMFAVMTLAPGTKVRQAGYSARPGLIEALPKVAHHVLWSYLELVVLRWPVVFACIAAGFALARIGNWASEVSTPRVAQVLCALSVGLIATLQLMAVVGTGFATVHRARFVWYLVTVVAFIAVGLAVAPEGIRSMRVSSAGVAALAPCLALLTFSIGPMVVAMPRLLRYQETNPFQSDIAELNDLSFVRQ